MKYTFTVAGVPRTKKTSQRIVKIQPRGGGRDFTKILPSELHEEWFALAMQQAPIIRGQLQRAGAALPIGGSVAVKATFYRERDAGDLLGFAQALADWMQEPIIKNGRMTRKGAGIIKDDVQIVSWDGSRLTKDACRPRIEVEVEVVGAYTPDLLLELQPGMAR